MKDDGSIIVTNIHKSYGEQVVLHQVNACFPKHCISAIMGPSGSGKTTLLRLLMKLEKPDGGEIKGLSGTKISAVFQEDRLCESMDAITNLQIVLNKHADLQGLLAGLAAMGLADTQGKPVSQFSGGMKRRVAILRALMVDADVYFMDEPFRGLDEELKQKVISYVKQRLAGKTVILVTHEESEARLLEAHEIFLENIKAKEKFEAADETGTG